MVFEFFCKKCYLETKKFFSSTMGANVLELNYAVEEPS